MEDKDLFLRMWPLHEGVNFTLYKVRASRYMVYRAEEGIMPKRNLKQRLIAALTVRGSVAPPDGLWLGRKYARLTVPATTPQQFYYIGESGALRRGTTLKGSVSLTKGQFYRTLLSEEI